MDEKTPEVWAVVELMGHQRAGGRLSEEEKFGVKLGRLDVPQKDGTFLTQYFGGSSVFRVSIVTEEMARAVAMSYPPRPVQAWELPRDEKPVAALPAHDDEQDIDF